MLSPRQTEPEHKKHKRRKISFIFLRLLCFLCSGSV
jgi:hypothetical protein